MSTRAQVSGRRIAIFMHKGAIYAVDGMCYHAGGPIAQGRLIEIEELDRRPCVVCPWHGYMIMLDSGEGIYRPSGPYDTPGDGSGCAVKSKGRKQRVHPVRVVDGRIEVALSSLPGMAADNFEYASDYYASDAYKTIMARARRAGAPSPPA